MEGELVMKNNFVLSLNNSVISNKTSVFSALLAVSLLAAYHLGFFTKLLAQETKGKELVAIASTTPIPKSLLKWENLTSL